MQRGFPAAFSESSGTSAFERFAQFLLFLAPFLIVRPIIRIVLVAAVSASWGIDARPDGKVTWAELRL